MHRSAYPNTSPHTRIHTHKQTATINKATHINTNHQTINKATHSDQQRPHTPSHTQTSWSQQRPPDPPPTPPIRNPRRRFETHAIENTQKNVPPCQKIPKKYPRPTMPIHHLTHDTPIGANHTHIGTNPSKPNRTHRSK